MHKTAFKTVIGIVAVLAILVGGGVGYTYYLGPEDTKIVAAVPVVAKPNVIDEPTKPAANAKVSASIQTLTSPVALGSNAAVTVKTLPGAKCTITVIYNGLASKDSGLAPKATDEYGVVSWSWTVNEPAIAGKWPVKVTCVLNERSAVVQGDLIVEASKP